MCVVFQDFKISQDLKVILYVAKLFSNARLGKVASFVENNHYSNPQHSEVRVHSMVTWSSNVLV